jgi:hypothetical protein
VVVVGFDVVVVIDVCHEDNDGGGMSEEQQFRACIIALSRRPYCPLELREHMIPPQSQIQKHWVLIFLVCCNAPYIGRIHVISQGRYTAL